jgi:phosphoglycolate phosphatase
MDKPKIFIDLDGTILDISEKAWRVYRDIMKENGRKYVSKKLYLSFGKNGAPIKKIIQKSGDGSIYGTFIKEWKKKIENADYLVLDKLPGARRKMLSWLSENFEVVLITLRSLPKSTFLQLKERKIDKFFKRVLVVPAKNRVSGPKWKLKYKTIKRCGGYKDSIMIGDTGTDILAGKKLGMKTIGVLWGIRNKGVLKRYKPDFLVRTPKELKNAILKLRKTI